MFLHAITVRVGSPTTDQLQTLARKLGNEWQQLGICLGFEPGEMAGFVNNNPGNFLEQKFAMLMEWKKKHGTDATCLVLYVALCHENVNRRDLAQLLS